MLGLCTKVPNKTIYKENIRVATIVKRKIVEETFAALHVDFCSFQFDEQKYPCTKVFLYQKSLGQLMQLQNIKINF